ncbi:hypothetical protein DACRYDRAFT_106181 [Dacryopinax primogenitus]|uniref:Aminoglycoside phosphotransferase domain-containing protein n=1 Tax=Dacryopinax primogenitus (strain DJM 731) TaxID=1858805 RepID=M5GE60_DACPD|nr:uncharacterized protein DACRYDRAFT_106181 [Dacryopinax primogenitus]EJU03003.1 hypothetical protein DACRYDRAFT_106181 [Dacryopinax primogenitus]
MWTIRGYVKQLRALRRPTSNVGTIDGTGKPGPCAGMQFGWCSRPGSFASYGALEAWFEHLRAITIDLSTGLPKIYGPPRDDRLLPHFDRSGPLVFTHGDIGTKNVRIGKDGKVWLIDWGMSGMYPPWWEYIGMLKYKESGRTTPPVPWLWARGIPFMAGWYPAAKKHLKSIRIGLKNPYFLIE